MNGLKLTDICNRPWPGPWSFLFSMVSIFFLFGIAYGESYTADFTSPVGSEWSRQSMSQTPDSGHSFLGEFGNDVVTLELWKDKPGPVTVSFDLFVIASWDGVDEVYGPDTWQLDVGGAETLLKTTFSNLEENEYEQSYPDTLGGGSHAAGTGAQAIDSLGYDYFGDSTYHLEFQFNHGSGPVILNFSATGLQELEDESWGLSNIKVDGASVNIRPKVVNVVGNWTVFGPCTLDMGCIFGTHKIETVWECDELGLRHGSSRPTSTTTGGGGYTIDQVVRERRDTHTYGVAAAIFYHRIQPAGSNPVQTGIGVAQSTIIDLLVESIEFASGAASTVVGGAVSLANSTLNIWLAMAASRPEILGLVTTNYDVVCNVDLLQASIEVDVQNLQHFHQGRNHWGFSPGGWRQIEARRLGSQAPSTLGPGERLEHPPTLFGSDEGNGVYTLRTHDAVVVTE